MAFGEDMQLIFLTHSNIIKLALAWLIVDSKIHKNLDIRKLLNAQNNKIRVN